MNVHRANLALKGLRGQPIWRLLAADNGPQVMALLNQLLMGEDKVLTTSVILERLAQALQQLEDQGEGLPQAPKAYLQDWLAQGWLARKLNPGASEEEYELTTDALTALRFVLSLSQKRRSATESRLASVITQVSQLAEETDSNPHTRMEALLAERARIDREIDAVRQGRVKTLSNERAIERAREIVLLVDELVADFRQVSDEFEGLNKSLRQSLLENEGSRGTVLDALFDGVDLISESEAGKTFNAFWKLLLDPEQSAVLADALQDISNRPFASQLSTEERKFLRNLTSTLIAEGGSVHNVLQAFARGLKTFVQSREFQEQKRLHALLKAAQKAALDAKDLVRSNTSLDYKLMLTGAAIRSVSQWNLNDPSDRASPIAMEDAPPSDISLELVERMLQHSEIDTWALKENILAMLAEGPSVSLQELLNRFPASQGLGTVVGYISLAAKHGHVSVDRDPVILRWESVNGESRQARVPPVFFTEESVNGFR